MMAATRAVVNVIPPKASLARSAEMLSSRFRAERGASLVTPEGWPKSARRATGRLQQGGTSRLKAVHLLIGPESQVQAQ